MKTSPVAVAGGILILIGGLALAFYTGTNGQALVAAKAKAVEKYVSMTEKALKEGDLKQAEKYAKEALAIDPRNRQALGEYKKVALASCPKAAPAPAPAAAQPAAATPAANAAKPAAAPAAAQPAQPAAESEEEMGCI
ncbi:MAG TPA: hypothetical protein ENJ74_04115 [Nitratifractor salsuginis]|uniref:Tetratricopeptide repeat protein n=1 Tax=Nitratifractor salsuginis TaxID=269261 RepID=A0A7V2SJJ6_9BACT|nr:hypothetical protein [Nitratifractor salsuginis]